MSEVPNTPDQADVTMSGGAVYDGAYTLLIADFSDTGTAKDAYEALKEVEDGRHVQIEGVIVVERPGTVTVEGISSQVDPSRLKSAPKVVSTRTGYRPFVR